MTTTSGTRRNARSTVAIAGLTWWPRRAAIRVGPFIATEPGDEKYAFGTVYAWWQWRQRLRMRSVRNLERFYLRPLIFGRDPR